MFDWYHDGPVPVRRVVDDIARSMVHDLSRDESLLTDLLAVLHPELSLMGASESEADRKIDILHAIVRRTAIALLPYVRVVLAEVVRQHVAAEHDAAIRSYFLAPHESYTLAELAAVWRVSIDDVRALYHDAVAEWSDVSHEQPDAMPIAWADSVRIAVKFNLLRSVDVERAMGRQLEEVRPASWRTAPVLIHLPIWLADAICRDIVAIPLVPQTASLAARIERAMLDLFLTDARLP